MKTNLRGGHVGGNGSKTKNLRVRELAEETGLKADTLYKRIARKEISSFKSGRCVLVPSTEVKRLLKDFRPAIHVREDALTA